MKVRKFTGPNSRSVLREMRAVLGADAVVLSTRDVPGGVEMLAIAEQDMVAIVSSASAPASAAAPAPARSPVPAAATLPVAPSVRGPESAGTTAAAAPAPAVFTSPRAAAPRVQPWQPASAVAPQPPRPAPAVSAPDLSTPATAPAVQTPDAVAIEIKSMRALIERELAQLARAAEAAPASAGGAIADEIRTMRDLIEKQQAVLAQAAAAQRALAERTRLAAQEVVAAEVKSMRALLQQELAALAWSDSLRRHPARAEAVRRLAASGFGDTLAREIAAAMPEEADVAETPRWLQGALAGRLHCVDAETIVAQGGVYALVGPTGSGKTTSTAKLAARAAMRFGSSRLALVTTDGYRVGAHDQLRVYGRILGVTVHAVHDPNALAALVASLADRHLVLIDTVGMGQRDARLAENLATLDRAGARRLLVASAASDVDTFEEVVRSYRGAAFAGCVLTKLDEAARLGGALDCVIRHRLPLHYVANGQRVPEDLHVPNAAYLAHRSLRASGAPVATDGGAANASRGALHA